MFDIPVALFIFKREEKSVQIVKRIGDVKPQKIYIVADGPRSKEEKILTDRCRNAVEKAIDWDCEVIKLYEEENKGCHNIGIAAMRIFETEPMCIFLEDDNYPIISFFEYCRQMLLEYKDDNRILWVCGTNYMTNYTPNPKSDYVFTQHMLPCGWASWGDKFNKYYEYDFKNLTDKSIKKAKSTYKNKRLFKYDLKNWLGEINYKEQHGRYASWDYHMNFSLRYHNKLGIAPKFNQITNIGVDSFSAHGGSSMENLLTSRFCEVPSKELSFPLTAPPEVKVNDIFEKKTAKIIMPPRKYYVKIFIRHLIPIPRDISIKKSLKYRKIVRKEPKA